MIYYLKRIPQIFSTTNRIPHISEFQLDLNDKDFNRHTHRRHSEDNVGGVGDGVGDGDGVGGSGHLHLRPLPPSPQRADLGEHRLELLLEVLI